MSGKWNEACGEHLSNCIHSMEIFADLLKRDIAMIAENHRVEGFVVENLEEAASNLVINHYPKASEALHMFINALSQVELARKVMYTRNHSLSETIFQSTLEQAKSVKALLKTRDQMIGKYLSALSAKQKARRPSERLDAALQKATTEYQTTNNQALFSVSKYAQQANRDLVISLSSFAHAQMEMYIQMIQVWGQVIETLDEMDIDADADAVTNQMMKAGNQIV